MVIIYNRDAFIKVGQDSEAEIGLIIHNCFLLCAVKWWFVVLTWKHPIRWWSSTTLVVPLIQSDLALELTGRSGSGSLANIHFGRHATPPIAYQHPKLGNNHHAPLIKLYLLQNRTNVQSALRYPADSTPADYGGGVGGVNTVMGIPSHLPFKSRSCDKLPLFCFFRQHQRFLPGCNQWVY